MIFSVVLDSFLHKASVNGAEHMTIRRVNRWNWTDKIRAMTFLSHQAIPDTGSTFWQDAKELTIKTMYLASRYLAF